MYAPQRGAVSTHTPHRLAEGSGLSAAARNTLKEEQGFLAGPLSPRASASRVILLAGRRTGPREEKRRKKKPTSCPYRHKSKMFLSLLENKLSFLKMCPVHTRTAENAAVHMPGLQVAL